MFFNKNKLSKEIQIIKIICIFWFIAKIISHKIWISDRLFPVISAFDIFSSIPNSIHLSLYFLSLSGLVFVFIFPINKKIITIFLITEVASCLLDQMRWQPWEYQYILTFLFFILSKNNKQFILLTSLLFVSTYFFGGFNKLNGGFLTSVWENIILKNIFFVSNNNIGLHYLGTTIALIEMFFGLALLIFKNKKNIVILVALMHVFILVLFGLLLNYNHIIVPWNIAMILLVFVLFYSENNQIVFKIIFKNALNFLVILILFLMPFLNKFGYWYSYFSFNLYNGNSKKITLCIENFDSYPELEQFKSKKTNKNCKNYKEIDTFNWTINYLCVPINADEFTFIELKKAWQKKYPKTNTHFFISNYPYKKENILEIK